MGLSASATAKTPTFVHTLRTAPLAWTEPFTVAITSERASKPVADGDNETRAIWSVRPEPTRHPQPRRPHVAGPLIFWNPNRGWDFLINLAKKHLIR